jgi:hypothetical protein
MLPWEKEEQNINSKLPWEENEAEVLNKKASDFKAWGIEPTKEKSIQYDMLRRYGLLSQNTMSVSYSEAHKMIYPKEKPKAGTEGYLMRDRDIPRQATSPVLGQGIRERAAKDMTTPIDTTGGFSAPLSMARTALDKYNKLSDSILKQPVPLIKEVARRLPDGREVEKQILLPPEERRGLPGVIASTVLPRVYTTPNAEVAQNPMMTLFQVLNLFGAGVASTLETTSESLGIGTPPKGLEKAGWVEREMANFSRAASGVEGIAELGEKAGKVLDKKYPTGSRIATGAISAGGSEFIRKIKGYLPEHISKNINDPSLDDLGWLLGLGVDVLIPSTGEVGSISTKLLKGFKAFPTPKELKADDGSKILENAQWNVSREIDFNKKGIPLKDPIEGYNSGRTLLINNNTVVKEDLFNEVESVVKLTYDKELGKIGVEYKLIDGIPTPTRSLIRVDNIVEFEKKLKDLENLKGKLDKPEGAAGIFVARQDLKTTRNLIQKIDDLTKDVSGLKDDVSPITLPTGDARKAAYKKVLKEEEKQLVERLSSISERWKYWVKQKDGISSAFNDLYKFKDEFKPEDKLKLDDIFPKLLRETLVNNMLDELSAAKNKVSVSTGLPSGSGNKINTDISLNNISDISDELLSAVDNLINTELIPSPEFKSLTALEKIDKVFNLLVENLNTGKLTLGESGAFGAANTVYKIENASKIDKNTILAKTYVQASKERMAEDMIERLGRIGVSHIHTVFSPNNILKLPVEYHDPQKIKDITRVVSETVNEAIKAIPLQQTLNVSVGRSSGDILSLIIKRIIGAVPMPDGGSGKIGLNKTYDDVWNDIINTPEIIDPLTAFAQEANEHALATITKLLLNDKTSRDKLTRIISADPEVQEQLGGLTKLAEDVVDRRAMAISERIIDTISKSIFTIGPDTPAAYKFLWLLISRHDKFLKSNLLGGVIGPNLRYLTMNLLSAPAIIYQQLGMKSAVGSFGELPNAINVMRNLRGWSPEKAKPVVKSNGDEYTISDLATIIIENNLTGGSARFEFTNSILEDVINNIPGSLANKPFADKVFDFLTWHTGVSGSPNMFNQLATDIDTTWRVSVLIDSLRRGDSKDLAIKKARESLFDYNAISQAEKKYIAHNIFFYSFMRHNLVSAVRNLVSAKGQTRIKNLLMPLYKPEDEDNMYAEYGTTRIKIPALKLTPGYELYGPSIPIAEALKQISDVLAIQYFFRRGQPGIASDVALDNIGQQTVNPYLEEFVSLLTGGKFDLRNRRHQGEGPDKRIVAVWKALGLLNPDGSGPVAELFSLTPDTNERYSGTKLDPMKANNYRFGTDEGRFNYAVFQRFFADVIFGLSRTPRDAAYLVDPRLSNIERLGAAAGFVTPLQEKSIIQMNAENNARVQERYRNK